MPTETTIDMRELGRAVAEHLPGKWRLHESDDRNELWARIVPATPGFTAHRGMKCISLRFMRTGRIEIFGAWPQAAGHGVISPGVSIGITVSPTKGPAAVAKDIERRFLFKYEQLYAECKVKADAYESRDRMQSECVQRIAKLINQRPSSNSTSIHIYADDCHTHGTLEVFPGAKDGKLTITTNMQNIEAMLTAVFGGNHAK